MAFDLTNKNISETFQNLLQKTGSDGSLYTLDGIKVGDLTIDGTMYADTGSFGKVESNVTIVDEPVSAYIVPSIVKSPTLIPSIV
jgi:hypothetical protein